MSTDPGTIFDGVWINWARGPVRGSTWTVSASNGLIISTFFGIFITLVGAQFWAILRFVIYQLSVTTETDTLQRQFQVILRNCDSAGGTALEVFLLPFSWRHSRADLATSTTKNPTLVFYLRSWVLATFAAFIFFGFVAAGGLASMIIATDGNEALILGSQCGAWSFSDNATSAQERQLLSKVLNETFIAANYARYCYASPSTSSLCNTYFQQQISWKTNETARCPFASGTCMFSDQVALQFDTELIDSCTILGVNSPTKDRVFYRRVTTCAPLNTTGRIEETGLSGPASRAYRYHFGSVLGQNFTLNYWYELVFYQQGYYLDTLASEAGSPESSWIPSSDLSLDDADVTLLSLAPNLLFYLDPIYDPFFAATQWTSSGYIAKVPSELVHFLGCADRHQFCKSNDFDQCTSLTGFRQLNLSVDNVPWTPRQRATVDRIQSTLNFSQIYHSVNGRGAAALLASEKVSQVISDGLPDNQWTIELSNWFATSLARLQHAMVEYATGPSDPSSEMIILPPTSKQDLELCHSQMVTAPGAYQSFSFPKLLLFSVLGILITAVSLALEPIARAVQELRKKEDKQGLLRWKLDGVKHLMCMVHEYSGMGTWARKQHSTPITIGLTKFTFPKQLDPAAPGWRSQASPDASTHALIPGGQIGTGTSQSLTTTTSFSSMPTTPLPINANNTAPGTHSLVTATNPAQPPPSGPGQPSSSGPTQLSPSGPGQPSSSGPTQPPPNSPTQPSPSGREHVVHTTP